MKITVEWRRTIQVAPFQPEVLALAVEDAYTGADHLAKLARMSRDLSMLGDQLIIERLAAHTAPKDAQQRGSHDRAASAGFAGLPEHHQPRGGGQPPTAPDPFVV